MLTVPQLLDTARAASSIQSDYRLARVLSVSDNALYTYRHAGRVPVEDVVFHLAQLAKLPPAFVLNCMSAERAKDPAIRAAYLAAAAALAPASGGGGSGNLPPSSASGRGPKSPMDKGDAGNRATSRAESREYTLSTRCVLG